MPRYMIGQCLVIRNLPMGGIRYNTGWSRPSGEAFPSCRAAPVAELAGDVSSPIALDWLGACCFPIRTCPSAVVGMWRAGASSRPDAIFSAMALRRSSSMAHTPHPYLSGIRDVLGQCPMMVSSRWSKLIWFAVDGKGFLASGGRMALPWCRLDPLGASLSAFLRRCRARGHPKPGSRRDPSRWSFRGRLFPRGRMHMASSGRDVSLFWRDRRTANGIVVCSERTEFLYIRKP